MPFIYKGKPLFPTKEALTELSDCDVSPEDALHILESGFEIRKRKKHITEKGIQRGNKVINIVAVDMGSYYKLIHAGKFTLSKKFRKLTRKQHGF